MHSPPAAAPATTYTTIPISGTDVIFRSFQNTSSFLSLRRPWLEFISNAASFDRPDSLNAAATRIRVNSKYFGVNYAIITTTCAALSLIGELKTLLIVASVFTMWLVLHVFREDPMVVFGHHVHDHAVTVCLVIITGIAIWTLGFVSSVLIGVAVGVLISIVHAVFRNPRGVYLDEIDAESEGLVSSPLVIQHISTDSGFSP